MIEEFAKNITAATNYEPASTVDYPRFQAVMDKYGYEWEAIKVTTEDDYIISTFHVLGKTGADPQ